MKKIIFSIMMLLNNLNMVAGDELVTIYFYPVKDQSKNTIFTNPYNKQSLSSERSFSLETATHTGYSIKREDIVDNTKDEHTINLGPNKLNQERHVYKDSSGNLYWIEKKLKPSVQTEKKIK